MIAFVPTDVHGPVALADCCHVYVIPTNPIIGADRLNIAEPVPPQIRFVEGEILPTFGVPVQIGGYSSNVTSSI